MSGRAETGVYMSFCVGVCVCIILIGDTGNLSYNN